jgi:hypothetical protein
MLFYWDFLVKSGQFRRKQSRGDEGPRRTPNSATPHLRLGCCADQTQNIIDIFENLNGICRNISEICRNINDILSLFRGCDDFIP